MGIQRGPCSSQFSQNLQILHEKKHAEIEARKSMTFEGLSGGDYTGGAACLVCRFCRSRPGFHHALLPLRGCGEYLKASPLPPAPFDSCGLANCWSACWLAGFLTGLLRACCLLTLIGRTCGTGRVLDQNSCLFGCLFSGTCFINFSAEMSYFL